MKSNTIEGETVFESLKRTLRTIKIETDQFLGRDHSDPGAIADCWNMVFDDIDQIEKNQSKPMSEGEIIEFARKKYPQWDQVPKVERDSFIEGFEVCASLNVNGGNISKDQNELKLRKEQSEKLPPDLYEFAKKWWMKGVRDSSDDVMFHDGLEPDFHDGYADQFNLDESPPSTDKGLREALEDGIKMGDWLIMMHGGEFPAVENWVAKAKQLLNKDLYE